MIGLESSTQELIDDGHAWHLEGSVGRELMRAIESGEARLGHRPARDYWGNHIPAWWMVEPGSLGSPEYQADASSDFRYLDTPFDREEAIEAWEAGTDPHREEDFNAWLRARLTEEEQHA